MRKCQMQRDAEVHWRNARLHAGRRRVVRNAGRGILDPLSRSVRTCGDFVRLAGRRHPESGSRIGPSDRKVPRAGRHRRFAPMQRRNAKNFAPIRHNRLPPNPPLTPTSSRCFPKVYAGPGGVDVSPFLKVKPGNAPNKIAVLSGAEMVLHRNLTPQRWNCRKSSRN